MNLVERFFRDLTVECIRDGSFASTKELVASIEAYLKDRDLAPKRYVWKAEGYAHPGKNPPRQNRSPGGK